MWEFKHSINSSKVYCKYVPSAAYMLGSSVLIVAKCIVNGGSIAAVPANWKY